MMKKDEVNELIVAAFAAGILVGIALIMVVLLIVRNVTDAYGAEAPVQYIEITEGPETATEAVPELKDLGEFTITYYCPCSRCNGKWGAVDGFGKPLKWGCVAVDRSVIPMHTKLVVDGFDMIFEARDTGSGVDGKHVDIFVPVSHSEALKMGQGEKKRVWKVIE